MADQFNPNDKMRKIRTRQGMSDYLDVKWRVIWLRSEHPDASIITEQVEGSETHARFKATITFRLRSIVGRDGGVDYEDITPDGVIVMVTGHGSETQSDFPDFYEKAETKAIGRACAVAGYGTDAAADFDDGEPMDGLPAAKGERAQRTEEEIAQRKQAIDSQHARNVQQPQAQPAQRPVPRPQSAIEGVRAVAGAQTVPVRTSNGSPAISQARREDEMLQAALPAPQRQPPRGGPVQQPQQEANSHLAAMREEMTSRPAPNAPLAPPEEAMSNVHQHAQLRALDEAGVDIAAHSKADYGVVGYHNLTREQAKALIIKCRALVPRT